MKKVIANVILITVLAKVLGFAREILLSYFFGATGISDAYLVSQTIPGTIFQFVGTGLATSFIPVFMNILTKEGKKRADSFTNTVISIVFIFSTFVILLVWVFTPFIIKIFASGFQGQTLYYAIWFTRINIMSLYFSSMIYVFTSYLQACNKFKMVAFAAIPNSIVIIASIILGAKLHIYALPIGSVVAVFIQLIFIYAGVKQREFKLSLNVDFKNKYVKEVYKLMIPVIIGVSVNQINVLVDRTIASNVAIGGISALLYADSLVMFVQGIFAQSIATIYYPTITLMSEENKISELKSQISEALGGMVFLLLPITVGAVILARPIVSLLYGRGAFSENAVNMTSIALMFYSIGIVAFGVRELLSRVFYAFHDTKTPMKNAMYGMILNIILNIILSRTMGIGGLAFATSMSSIVTSMLLFLHLTERIGVFIKPNFIKNILKILISVFVLGVISAIMYYIVFEKYGLYCRLFLTVFIGGVVYFIMTLILKIEIVTDIIREIKHKKTAGS